MKIEITSVNNGWVIKPETSSYAAMPDGSVKVARSPKELSGLIESWATGDGKPEEKKAKP